VTVLAQQNGGETVQPGFFSEGLLDQYHIPVGPWAEQTVKWMAVRLTVLFEIIEWPFRTLIDFLVDDILEPISWVWVLLAFFVVGTLIRGVKVGVFSALGLGLCAILGVDFWLQTVRTIGYIGVAVLACVVIGLPLGVLCGRVDSAWRVVRPVLDGMQVVHSFVYMLPFIFFWGFGVVSATMVTMIFALPPLVRLTNLGIRQVREDVLEASRAYGAPEWRVLFDVQLPLARPAIATGINQTLLLAISMLGIAAIMGAGGLGQLLLKAIWDQSVSKGAASGLAFFVVAVVLDRISQPEGTESKGLLRRIRRAWAHRRDPEGLLESTEDAPSAESVGSEGVFAAVTAGERPWMVVSGIGGLLAVVSVFLVWTADAGFISAYGRRADENLAGESFNGLSASGGSWFGFLTFGLGLWVLASVVTVWLVPGRGPRYFTTDGALIGALALLVMMVCYVLASPSGPSSPGTGLGVWAALVGGLVATVGSLVWIRRAPHAPLHPLSLKIGWGRVIGGSIAALIILIGMFSAWSFDRRSDQVMTADTLARIEELRQQARDNPEDAGPISAKISVLTAQMNVTQLAVTDGVSSEGTRLGLWTLIAGLAGLATVLPAAGVMGRDEHRQWRWSTTTAGIGAGVACVTFGWIAVHVRSADPNYLSGVGSFLTLLGGVFLVVTATAILKEFRRSKVYADA
jgi:glycine betaine/proline transport system permease protein